MMAVPVRELVDRLLSRPLHREDTPADGYYVRASPSEFESIRRHLSDYADILSQQQEVSDG